MVKLFFLGESILKKDKGAGYCFFSIFWYAIDMIKAVSSRHYPIHFSCLLLLSGFLLSACRTGSQVFPASGELSSIPYIQYINEGIKFSFAPLPHIILEDIHGLNSRYFTESPGLVPPRRPLVLDVRIASEEESDVTILYGDALLIHGEGPPASSLSRQEFYDLWVGKTAPSLRSRLSWLIDHNIHKKTIIVSSHSQSRGYFLFLLNSPRRGDFILTVPVVIDNQRGVLSLPVTLDIDPLPTAEDPVPTGPVFIPDRN